MSSTFPANKDKHFEIVGRMRCLISNAQTPTIHHARGRSIAERLTALGLPHSNGTARRAYSDALILPLAAHFHTGDEGVDLIGVETWEAKYGRQADMIDRVSQHVGYDLWELHRGWTDHVVPKILPRRY